MGKTTLMVKLLTIEWVNKFKKIYVFCPTYVQDKTWAPIDEHVLSGKVEIIQKYDPLKVKKLWAKCKKLKVEKPEDHYLFYFDDCGGDEGFKINEPTGILNKLVSKGNHSNISTIYVVQSFIMASTIMRFNAEVFITFLTQTDSQQKHIYNEFGIGTFKTFAKIMVECTKAPYNFFVINRQGPGVADYYHNYRQIPINLFLNS